MENIKKLVDEIAKGFFTLDDMKELARDYHKNANEFGPIHTIESYTHEWLINRAKELMAKEKIDSAMEYYTHHKSTGLDNSDNSNVLMNSLRIAAGLDDSDVKQGKTSKKETFDPSCTIEVSYKVLEQFAKDARNYSVEPRVINIESVGEYFNNI